MNFVQTLYGASATTVNAGTTIFGGAVGGGTALLSLTTDAAGNTAVNGGLVTTTGAQLYNDTVTLGAAETTFNGSSVNFVQTLNGASATTVNAGTTIFGGAVGGGTALLSLTTDAAGNTAVNGGLVTTTGNQIYNDIVTTPGATIFRAGSGDLIAKNAGNNFVGLVTVGAANNVELRDTNTLNLAAINPLVPGGSPVTGNVSIWSGDALALPEIRLAAGKNLTVTTDNANAHVTQTGILVVPGTTSIKVGTGANITLDNVDNNFTGAVNADGANISLVDVNVILLGNVKATGTLGVDAKSGSITQTTAAADKVEVTGLTTLNATSEINLNNLLNNFDGAVTATAGTNITLQDTNDLVVGGLTARTGAVRGDVTLNTGGKITQTATGAIIAKKLTITAGDSVRLDKLNGIAGINEIDILGVVTLTKGDFALFDKGVGTGQTVGLKLEENISANRVKIVTQGGIEASSMKITTGIGGPGGNDIGGTVAATRNSGFDPGNNASTVLVANHNDQGGEFKATGLDLNSAGRTVIYVNSKDETTGVTPVRFSGTTFYNNDSGNTLLDVPSQDVTGIILATSGPSANNDLLGQTDARALMRLIEEMTDPGKRTGAITLDYNKRKFIKGVNKQKEPKGAGSLVPGRYGPFQMTGYDYEDLKRNGYGTPEFDPTKLEELTLQSILEGLPFVQ